MAVHLVAALDENFAIGKQEGCLGTSRTTCFISRS